MLYENVTIRTKEQLKTSKPEIKTALLDQVSMPDKSKSKFPLIYKYLEGSKSFSLTYDIQDENIIGEVSNIHKSNDGSIVADVIIRDAKALANQFVGSIDNVVVGMTTTPSRTHRLYPIITSFIVYDKFAKQVIDQKNRGTNNTGMTKLYDSPTEGDIAVDKDDNPLHHPEVMDAIDEALEREVKGYDGANS